MSVKDRIKAMNMKCSAPVETVPPLENSRVSRTRSYENPVKDRISAMNTSCSAAARETTVAPEKRVLRSWNSETHSKCRAFDAPARTRSVEGPTKTPMKLPGLITDKGGE